MICSTTNFRFIMYFKLRSLKLINLTYKTTENLNGGYHQINF